MTRTQAICASIATSNDHDVLARGQNFTCGIDGIAVAALVLLRQEFHCKVNSLQFAPWNLQIARLFRTSGKHDGIEVTSQLLNGDVASDLGIRDELHAFGGHLLDAAIDDVLLELELRDPVAKQTANTIGFFVDRNRVPCTAELLGRREPCRS